MVLLLDAPLKLELPPKPLPLDPPLKLELPPKALPLDPPLKLHAPWPDILAGPRLLLLLREEAACLEDWLKKLMFAAERTEDLPCAEMQ